MRRIDFTDLFLERKFPLSFVGHSDVLMGSVALNDVTLAEQLKALQTSKMSLFIVFNLIHGRVWSNCFLTFSVFKKHMFA